MFYFFINLIYTYSEEGWASRITNEVTLINTFCHSGTSISEVIESLHEASEEISWSQSFKNFKKMINKTKKRLLSFGSISEEL
jgi:hypothetical protein